MTIHAVLAIACAAIFAGAASQAVAQQKPMTEQQARAYCAKRAEQNASATRRQMWADACVRQVMTAQKKS